jgi:hypothetical protein
VKYLLILCFLFAGCTPTAKTDKSYDVGTCHANDDFGVVVKVKQRLEFGLLVDRIDRSTTFRLETLRTAERELYVTYDIVDGDRGYRSDFFRQVDCIIYERTEIK